MLDLTVRTLAGVPERHRLASDCVTLGRGEDRDIVIEDLLVSRRHAEIRREDDGWVVTDLGSRHGTRLNGAPLTGPAPLRPGDEIAIGSVVIVFEPNAAKPSTKVGQLPTRSHASEAASGDELPALVGQTATMRSLRSMIDKLASASATVLITGESGTGKEVVARLLHVRSPRVALPFVVVNCPALPGSLIEYELFGVAPRVATGVDARPGKLEQADTGTLFLDEIGDMDMGAQAKLLRFLQDKTVERIGGRGAVRLDVRVLAATNHDLQTAIEEGRFRLDLYHRLNSVHLELAPLRERLGDIPLLVEHFLSRAPGPRLRVSDEVLERLARYDFPGNVRELERILERGRLLADGRLITPDLLPRLDRPGSTDRAVTATELYDRVTGAGESFWELVHEPFLGRSLSADVVRELMARAYGEAGRSYREMGRRFGIEDFREYKKLTSFLRNHDLLPERKTRRE